jgi:hypothetical protein
VKTYIKLDSGIQPIGPGCLQSVHTQSLFRARLKRLHLRGDIARFIRIDAIVLGVMHSDAGGSRIEWLPPEALPDPQIEGSAENIVCISYDLGDEFISRLWHPGMLVSLHIENMSGRPIRVLGAWEVEDLSNWDWNDKMMGGEP